MNGQLDIFSIDKPQKMNELVKKELQRIEEARLKAKINQKIKRIRVTPSFYKMLMTEVNEVILYNFNPIEYTFFGVPLVIDETIKDKHFEIDYIY